MATNGNVQSVTREYILAALTRFEETDTEAANALRAWIDAHYLLQDEPLDICDMLQKAEARAKLLSSRVHECAIQFQRMACGSYDDDARG